MRAVPLALLVTSACAAVAVGTSEIFWVQPVVAHARQALNEASPDERNPPAELVRLLLDPRALHLDSAVTRQAVHQSRSCATTQLDRQLCEAAVAWLLPLHLSPEERRAFFLSQTHMGEGVRGFSQASVRYLGAPLHRVDRRQAAELLAISHGPSVYAGSPDRLARRVAHLLASEPR